MVTLEKLSYTKTLAFCLDIESSLAKDYTSLLDTYIKERAIRNARFLKQLEKYVLQQGYTYNYAVESIKYTSGNPDLNSFLTNKDIQEIAKTLEVLWRGNTTGLSNNKHDLQAGWYIACWTSIFICQHNYVTQSDLKTFLKTDGKIANEELFIRGLIG